MTRPRRDIKSRLIRARRHFTNIRQVGGSTIITLSRPIRESAGFEVGDQLLVEWNAIDQRLEIKKDSDTAREGSMVGARNLKRLTDQLFDLHNAKEYGDPEWCKVMEGLMRSIVSHLKGDIIDIDS